MDKKIVIGSIVSVFMLAMLPSIPAIDSTVAKTTNTQTLLQKTRTLLQEIKEKKEPATIGAIIALIGTSLIIFLIVYLWVITHGQLIIMNPFD